MFSMPSVSLSTVGAVYHCFSSMHITGGTGMQYTDWWYRKKFMNFRNVSCTVKVVSNIKKKNKVCTKTLVIV
jgi:hypothetical protein